MRPLALVFYENLLTGNQILNKLRELGYRTALASDLHQIAEQASKERPLVFLVELGQEVERSCDAIHRLKSNPSTAHIPVLAYGRLGESKPGRKMAQAATAAGATLVAAEGGMLSQLAQLLDQVLLIE